MKPRPTIRLRAISRNEPLRACDAPAPDRGSGVTAATARLWAHPASFPLGNHVLDEERNNLSDGSSYCGFPCVRMRNQLNDQNCHRARQDTRAHLGRGSPTCRLGCCRSLTPRICCCGCHIRPPRTTSKSRNDRCIRFPSNPMDLFPQPHKSIKDRSRAPIFVASPTGEAYDLRRRCNLGAHLRA